MRKVLPLIFSGVAAISFGAIAQTTTTTPSDTKPAEVDRTTKGSPASGSTTIRRSDAAGPNAGASRSSDATTGASSDNKATDKPRKARKAKKDRNASQGSSSSTAGSSPASANQGGQAGTQAPATSAAGAPGTVGTQGNPGPGAAPHSGSGASK